MAVAVSDFGGGVKQFVLRGAGGLELVVLDFGATVQALRVPLGDGTLRDVCVGFDSLEGFRANPYFGQVIGRVANRIGGGAFVLDGRRYELSRNLGAHTLHSGTAGWHERLWRGKVIDESAVRLSLSDGDGAGGFPGRVEASVVYRVLPDNTWRIEYEASTDRATPINLTQHLYFNLNGEGAGDVLGHVLEVCAEAFTATDGDAIPTGELRAVGGTPFDFTTPRVIGERIDGEDEQLRIGRGYDHNFVLTHAAGVLGRAARVAAGGVALEVWTSEPGVQVYTGNWIAEGLRGKSVYGPRAGMCLETQHFPDAPNQPSFPSTIVRPGEVYRSVTEFRFGLAESMA